MSVEAPLSGLKLWILPIVDVHKAALDAHCFGDCGRVQIGCLVLTLGDGTEIPCWVCDREDCPHLERELAKPEGTNQNGDQLFLRKVKL